jgi:hypothetical protein
MSGTKPDQPKSKKPKRAGPRTRLYTRIPIWLWAAIGAFCTLLGGFSAVVTFLPRVTAVVSDPVDPTDPFSSSVTVTNTGYLPLNSVVPFVRINELRYGNLSRPLILNSTNSYGLGITAERQPPVRLGLDDRFTFDIHQALPALPPLLSRADIAISIRYKIPLIFLTREKMFPLVADRDTNGNFRWRLLAPPN